MKETKEKSNRIVIKKYLFGGGGLFVPPQQLLLLVSRHVPRSNKVPVNCNLSPKEIQMSQAYGLTKLHQNLRVEPLKKISSNNGKNTRI